MTIEKDNKYDLKNLRILPYIGKKRAKRLKEAGLDTIDKIARSSPEELKEILVELRDSQIEKIIKMAREVALSAGVEVSAALEEKMEEKAEKVKAMAKEEEKISEKTEEKKEVGGEEVKEVEEKEKIELAKWLFGGEYKEIIKGKVQKERRESGRRDIRER